jgi:hypothetical protein
MALDPPQRILIRRCHLGWILRALSILAWGRIAPLERPVWPSEQETGHNKEPIWSIEVRPRLARPAEQHASSI